MTRTRPDAPLRLPDRLGPGLRLLFVGINPSVRSAELGHHFAGHGNRFWRLLHDAGLVPERLSFEQDVRLPEWGYGLTNIVPRPTRSMAELAPAEYRAGAARLRRLVRARRPAVVALVGVTVFRALFPVHRGAVPLGVPVGELGGVPVAVVPNPSGRNAHYGYDAMREAYAGLRALASDSNASASPRAAGRPAPRSPRSPRRARAARRR